MAELPPKAENENIPQSVDQETDQLDHSAHDAPAFDLHDKVLPDASQSTPSSDSTEAPKKRKSVGFAPEPEQDLKEHHKYIEDRKKDRLQSNPFWKIPAELAYLEPRQEGPKPLPKLPSVPKPRKPKKLDDMKDLPTRAVKEISVVNKNTALNFFYHEIDIPVGPDRILVDVKYVSLSSFDLSKLSKYTLNMSNTRVGLGYDYVGEICSVGASFKDHPDYKVGTLVFGVVGPRQRKGSLQTLVIINPKDVIVPIDSDTLEQLSKIDIKLSTSLKSPFLVDENDSQTSSLSDTSLSSSDDEVVTNENSKPASSKKPDPYKITDELPDLAKFCVFSSQFCRAKQSLEIVESKLKRQGSANILINGADTGLGRTLVQILNSSIYSENIRELNVILVVLNANLKTMESFVAGLGSGGFRKFHVVSFDVENTDLILPHERVPIAYKKAPLFATEILGCLFESVTESELISKANVDKIKLDLFIDIIGSHKLFQHSLDMKILNEVNFPSKSRMSPGVKLSSLFGSAKEPLFTRILKPKNDGSAYVSYCKFTLPEPSYQVENLIDYSGKSMFDPWSMKWTSDLANLLVAKYNYYEKLELEVKSEWVEQALQLALKGELKMKVDEYVDWRSNFRAYIEELKNRDGQVVFRIESF